MSKHDHCFANTALATWSGFIVEKTGTEMKFCGPLRQEHLLNRFCVPIKIASEPFTSHIVIPLIDTVDPDVICHASSGSVIREKIALVSLSSALHGSRY